MSLKPTVELQPYLLHLAHLQMLTAEAMARLRLLPLPSSARRRCVSVVAKKNV